MKKYMLLLLCIIAQTEQIKPVPLKTSNITRAGVGIIVPLNHCALQNPTLDNYGIIVGHDRNLKRWMIGQAGKTDTTDTTSEAAASRELFEETGCAVKISKEKIKLFPSIITDDKELFMMKCNDSTLAQKIHNSVQKAQKNPMLPSCYKEIDKIVVVKLSTLLKLGKQIESNTLKKSQYKKSFFAKNTDYYITAENGCKILVDGYYMRIFGNSRALNTNKKAQIILEKLIVKS